MPELPAWPADDYPDRPTAEAYANAPERLYPAVDKQRIHLSKQWLFPHKCPNCLQPMAVVDAIHVDGDNFVCGMCEAKLLFTVPLVQVGPVHWEWRIAPGQINVVSQDPEKDPGLEADEKFLRKFGNEGDQ